MNKDVIYIDVEDDITAIIGKVKAAKEKIVAIVPPKRIGVLQSAVNLRLLARAATQSNKHLVLISSNSALVALAAAAKVPVAKNLQSKPELAEIAAIDIDNGEDVIDGSQLPIGELAKTADDGMGSIAFGASAAGATLNENAAEEIPKAAPPLAGQLPTRPKAKSGVKVPNFSKFRKKLIFGIGGGILLIAFLVWAVFFAPHATVIITARTTDTSANTKVTLGSAVATNAATSSLKTTVQQTKKDLSVTFDATGSKDAGTKATGKMTLTRTSPSTIPLTVPAGTQFTSGSIVFVSTESATLTSQLTPTGLSPGSGTVGVQAAQIGDEYNLSARSYQPSVDGVSAQGTDMSGGAHHQITTVSADDVQKATAQLAQQSSDDIKKQLTSQFSKDYYVVDQSFKIDQGTPQSSPAVDQEVPAGTKPKLTTTATYSLSGIVKSDINSFLTDYFNKQLVNSNAQRVYDNGVAGVSFSDVAATDSGFTANLVATAKVGPKIDDNAIKNQAKGKRFGDIQSSIESIQGVDNVDVKFSPFWVNSAPSDTSRINVEFNLNESK